MKNRRWMVGLPLTVIVASALMVSCKSKPPEQFVNDVSVDVKATVVGVDPVKRIVSLQGPNGPATVVAGPEVRNFAQIHVGDEVQVTYYAGIAAQMKKKGSAGGAAVEESDVYTAPLGDKPGAGVSNTITTIVTIIAVDTTLNTVTFKRPDGWESTLPVESDKGREYIRKLKPGDEVEIVYTEAVAVAVVPGAK